MVHLEEIGAESEQEEEGCGKGGVQLQKEIEVEKERAAHEGYQEDQLVSGKETRYVQHLLA